MDGLDKKNSVAEANQVIKAIALILHKLGMKSKGQT